MTYQFDEGSIQKFVIYTPYYIHICKNRLSPKVAGCRLRFFINSIRKVFGIIRVITNISFHTIKSIKENKTQPATRLRFRFYIHHFSHPTRPCATQLYIVYYFFNFYFIYIRYAYTHTHAKGESEKVAGCRLRFRRGPNKLTQAQLRHFATATLQPS